MQQAVIGGRGRSEITYGKDGVLCLESKREAVIEGKVVKCLNTDPAKSPWDGSSAAEFRIS